MSTEVVVAVIAATLPTLAASLLGTFRIFRAIQKSQLALLKSSVAKDCRDYIQRGLVTGEELSMIEELFEHYTMLKGNGYIRTLVDKVRALPIRED